MTVKLVKTTTADGLRLDGALRIPQRSDPALAVDALLCLHGVGSNFYGSSLFAGLEPRLLESGVALLWVNTRGHDSVFTAGTTTGPRRLGAAYEIVSECTLDVTAWIEFMRDRQFERIGVLGHSLGALKAVYSEAHTPHPDTSRVIAISAPRLSYSAFQAAEMGGPFVESMLEAKEKVKRGQPDELIEASFPLPILISAAGFIDKYGPGEKYNLVKFAHRLRSPALFTYGGRELQQGGVAFAGVPDALRNLPDHGQQFEVATIPDADHNYTGRHPELAGVIVDWLQRR